jgi:Ca-activated chloride channel homolog
MRLLAHTASVLGALVALVSAAPQKGPEKPPTISVETNLVLLSVTVVDRNGAFVPGLPQQNFTVYDNGQSQAIEFFTNDDVPATVGLVIDSSSSMRGRRQEVTAAATAFANVGHPLDELFTMNFNEFVWPGLPPPFAFAQNVDQLRAALAQAPARGMTALYDAIDLSLTHLQLGTRDRKALIVVSDGGDNASSSAFDDVREHARRTSTVIYAVLLIDPNDRDARSGELKALAKETGGTAFAPQGAQDMMSFFRHIGLEIRAGYTIAFSPRGASRDGFRTIQVAVHDMNRHQLIARTRRGYYAGRSARPTV